MSQNTLPRKGTLPMNKPLLLAMIAMALPSVAAAQQAPDNTGPENAGPRNTVLVAGGIAAVPRFEGGDSYQPIPLAILRANWEYRYIAIEGPAVRANIVNSPAIEAGPLLGIVLDRSGELGSDAVERLGTIKVAAELGAFAAYNFNLSSTSRLRLGLDASHDVTGVHDGWQARASLGYSIAPAQRLRLNAIATATFADGNYARTYFGITPTGSFASGLPAFTPDGGLKDIGVAMTASYSLSQRWSLTAIGSYRRLVGDFADSPIVSREGSPNQLFGGLGLGYAF